jgi:hypothetical protein
MTEKELGLPSSVHEEVPHWFFDHYLPTWVGVCAGTIARGPEAVGLHRRAGPQGDRVSRRRAPLLT